MLVDQGKMCRVPRLFIVEAEWTLSFELSPVGILHLIQNVSSCGFRKMGSKLDVLCLFIFVIDAWEVAAICWLVLFSENSDLLDVVNYCFLVWSRLRNCDSKGNGWKKFSCIGELWTLNITLWFSFIELDCRVINLFHRGKIDFVVTFAISNMQLLFFFTSNVYVQVLCRHLTKRTF